MLTRLRQFFDTHPELSRILTQSMRERLARQLEDEFLHDFVSEIIAESEHILAIDPRLDKKTILETAARSITRSLGAQAATIRLLEPYSLKMLNFGAFGLDDADRTAAIPADKSIAGKVVIERRSVAVPSILKDPLYQNKEIVRKKGFHSMLAVPLVIPSFVVSKNDLLGSLQIYYREDNRRFHRLDILRAEMLARRVSYVLAKKKILDLYDLNTRKEKIVDTIFVKLSNRESIKLREIFMMLIEELGELLQLQGCSLFTVTPDRRHIYLEAAHPLDLTYHQPGHSFTIANHPYFSALLESPPRRQDSPFQRQDENHLLIRDPQRSPLATDGLRRFAADNAISSMLLIPIRVAESVRHILLVYARGNKLIFSDDEIELLTFFGKEIMKAAKLESLGDTLHDFKNPAVAVAGIAGRLRRALETDELETVRDKLIRYADVIIRETTRMQDMALTRAGEERAEILDMGDIAARRYALNEAVIKENRLSDVTVLPADIQENLFVFCPQAGLERVVDNLLHNATRAVAEHLSAFQLLSYLKKDMACLEVRNSGGIAPERLEEIRSGRVKGRGLEIINRFVTVNHGRLDISSANGETVFRIALPLADGDDSQAG